MSLGRLEGIGGRASLSGYAALGFGQGSRRETASLAALLLAALLLRLALLGLPGFPGDAGYFSRWATALLSVPPGDFYSRVLDCEYLPGYLYLLDATTRLRVALAGSVGSPQQFLIWVKAGSLIADLAMVVAAYGLCRRWVGAKGALWAAALLAFNPGLLFVSSVWGQVDSVACAFALFSLLALLSGRPAAAALLGAIAFVTKPQYALFLGVGAVAYLRVEGAGLLSLWQARLPWMRLAVQRFLLPLALLLATVELLLRPFAVSLWPWAGTRWTIYQRLAIAQAKYDDATVNAFNLWGTPIAGPSEPDSVQGWFSLSFQHWGYLLLAAVFALVLYAVWSRANRIHVVLWGCFVVSYGFFVLPTRIHERYLFVALALLSIAVLFRRWLIPFYLALVALSLANLWYSLATVPEGYWRDRAADLEMLVSTASIFGVLLLVASLAVLAVLAMEKPSPENGVSLGVSRSSRRAQMVSGVAVFGSLALAVILAQLASDVPPWERWTAPGSHLVKVRADRLWQDSGMKLSEGQRVTLSARGEWANERRGPKFGPDGTDRIDGGALLASAPIGVLIGRVGDSSPFAISAGGTFSPPQAGSLLLSMNDWPEGRAHNRGSVIVTIRTEAP